MTVAAALSAFAVGAIIGIALIWGALEAFSQGWVSWDG